MAHFPSPLILSLYQSHGTRGYVKTPASSRAVGDFVSSMTPYTTYEFVHMRNMKEGLYKATKQYMIEVNINRVISLPPISYLASEA